MIFAMPLPARFLLFALFCAAPVLALPQAARAAESATETGVTRLSLIAASRAHDGTPLLAGIDMALAKGWKTYWRVPGDSGIAPVFDWSASQNVAGVELRWPAPRRFDDPGDITYGYKDEVIWPLRVVPADPSLPVLLRLSMFYGVCSDAVCVPRDATLSLDLPAMPDDWKMMETPAAPRLRAALARVPVPPVDAGILTARWQADAAPTLDVRFHGCGPGCDTPALIVEGPRNVWFGVPAITREDDTVRYLVPVEVLSAAMLEGEEFTFILSGTLSGIPSGTDKAYVIRKRLAAGG